MPFGHKAITITPDKKITYNIEYYAKNAISASKQIEQLVEHTENIATRMEQKLDEWEATTITVEPTPVTVDVDLTSILTAISEIDIQPSVTIQPTPVTVQPTSVTVEPTPITVDIDLRVIYFLLVLNMLIAIAALTVGIF